MLRRLRIILLLLPMLLASCGWQEAKDVIAMADSLDQTEHVIYDDTAALGQTIRTLDNPVSRLLMNNTLGKAHYDMGRNLEDYHQQVAEAAEHYIEADRLQIDDPIYRGRVNSCMGYICAQNNNDSLALIFYERASKDFQESGEEWYYAQTLLDRSEFNINLQNYIVADSLLQIARTYQMERAYQAQYYETRGLYFYEQQQYDFALIYFQKGLDYWQTEEDKGFSYLKIMQIYYKKHLLNKALPYAQRLLQNSTNPNYIANAYYCLMQDAKSKNNVELLSQYSHARTDAQKLLRDCMVKDAEAVPILLDYLENPFPFRWISIVLCSFVALCIVLVLGIFTYRKYAITRMQVSDNQIVSLSAQVQEHQEELQKHSKLHYYDERLDKIRRKYPKPLNRWNEYSELRKDVLPYLHNWCLALEELELTNREKVFCVFTFVYPQLSAADIANYLCITKDSLLVRKNRIAKKLGVTSVELGSFLQNLANNE